jgi:hypothetical protein
MSDEDYVTNDAWLRTAARADAIDDIADQFERPAVGAEAFWSLGSRTRWPETPLGWTSDDRLRTGTSEIQTPAMQPH